MTSTLSQEMNSTVAALFQYTRSQVTEQDIIDFSPGDPGYPNYVQLWTEIWRSGKIPRQAEFDCSEVIGLTGWEDPDEYDEPERFQNYRRFTSAVAVALVEIEDDCDDVRSANYLARDLIIDINPRDQDHLSLVRNVMAPTAKHLARSASAVERPFFTFGEMILAQLAGDFTASDDGASRLIADEAEVRSDESINHYVQDDRFLLGLTVYDQLHSDWLAFASALKNPNDHEDTQLVIDALKQCGDNKPAQINPIPFRDER